MKIRSKNYIATLCVLLIMAVVLPMLITSTVGVTHAAYNFDDSNVLDDLQSSTVNGKPFNILDFAYDQTQDVRIINFVEYCYSFKANKQSNYALYIYVYNPKGLSLVEQSGQNKIQMAVDWTQDSDGDLTASRYEKFTLKFCNKSEKADYKGLFYKFRVIDHDYNGKDMIERVNSNERRYDVSGIELLTSGNQNATEYGIGGTYKFTGYAKGFGNGNEEDTLSCVVEELETARLQVYHTSYRTNVSNKGANHYNQVNTVYFELPKRFLDTYGTLQKIHAEWWEYKTKMAVVTSNLDFYNQIKEYTGYVLQNNQSSWQQDKAVPYYVRAGYHKGFGGSGYYDWSYNWLPYFGTQTAVSSRIYSNFIPLAFYAPKTKGVDSLLDFFYSRTSAGDVPCTEVAKAIYEYTNSLGNGYVDCNGRHISKDLFEDSIDEDRSNNGINMGYNDVTLDLDEDKFDLNTFDDLFENNAQKFLAKFLAFGFKQPETDGTLKNIPPIYILKSGDLSGSNKDIADRLLVSESNVDEIKRLQWSAETVDPLDSEDEEKVVVLFRFATSDYYCADGSRGYPDSKEPNGSNYVDGDVYVAQQTVFLDFDIIDLTFNKDGVYRVIPAVSSPTDIINGFTAPPRTKNILAIIIAVIIAILLLIILQATGILPLIFKGIGWVICLPFRLIKNAVNNRKPSAPTPKSAPKSKPKQSKKSNTRRNK